MGLDDISGRWGHRNEEYDESLWNVARFQYYDVPSDAEWHEVTLRLSDSPFLKPNDDVVFMFFAMSDADLNSEEVEDRYDALLEGSAFLDIDRIESVRVDETILEPVITDFYPKRGKRGTTVTIEGSGFAEPASRNVVLFGDLIAEVISGNSTTLVVEYDGSGVTSITVLAPGGKEAVSAQPFAHVRPPRNMLIDSGDAQISPVGATLEPICIKLVNINGNGVPEEHVTFQIISGIGTLSAAESMTNDDGIACIRLTLGDTLGPVNVQAKWNVFRPVVFTATAIPQ